MSTANPIEVDKLDQLLPQTQCRRCGYDGCRPYAKAVAANEADINRCPPGGPETIQRLAEVTDKPAKPLAEDCADGEFTSRQVAAIDEPICIGCTKCIAACPTDAIVGAGKRMHTVIASECTGCELCLPACPVDCIDLLPAEPQEGQPHWPPQSELDRQRAELARERFEARNQRLATEQQRRGEKRHTRLGVAKGGKLAPMPKDTAAIKSDLEAAVARAKARKSKDST